MAGGMHGGRHMWWGHAWQGGMHFTGHVWQVGMHGRGACMARGRAWQGGVHGWVACVAGDTATAADGMHPTGMHSC